MSEVLAFKESLRENLYAPIGIDLGYSDFATAAEAFEEFMKLPGQIIDSSKFKLDTRNNTQFGAFERRVGDLNAEGRGLDQDNKNIFHFGSLTRQVMEYRLGKNLPADAKRFLNLAEEVYWAGVSSFHNALTMLDQECMGLVGIHFDEKAALNHHLRFAAYFPREGELLATPHCDRSVGTIKMAENKPGLWFGDVENKRYVEPHIDRKGLFFLGAGWDKLPASYKYGNEDLVAAPHGVDQVDTECDENGIMRWAIVLFGNPYEMDTVPSAIETRPYKAMGQKVFELAR